jgi:serine/threonine-protein kinase
MAPSVALGTQLGSYRVESVIGGGPFGAVYRARHVRLGTGAAVKVLADEWSADPSFRDRFLHDVHLAAELDHRNVVPIHDAGVEGDSLYVVTRYVTGGDLKALLSRGGALGVEWASSVLGPVAQALDAAHARGLVHGDVKPTNVLVEWSPAGDVERTWLTDFGMPWQARAGDGAGALADRFDYASPEQIAARAVTPGADVYSLGCVLYHAVTGKVPFRRDVLQSHLHARVEPPSTARADLPAGVDAPILKAMAKEPRERYETCEALMRAFGDALRAPSLTQPPAPRAPAPAPAPPPAAPAVPRTENGAAPAAPRADGRRRLRIAALAGLAVAAAVGGYALSRTTGGGNDQSPGPARAAAPGGIRALAARDPLRAVIAKNLPDVQCAVTRAPAGGAVVENATCVPRTAGDRSLGRLTLTLFADREALNRLYEAARALVQDPAVRRRSDCGPDRPYGGHGRWSTGGARAGKMFCEPRAGRPRVVWTVDESKVLGEATAADSTELGAWWVSSRYLRAAGRRS